MVFVLCSFMDELISASLTGYLFRLDFCIQSAYQTAMLGRLSAAFDGGCKTAGVTWPGLSSAAPSVLFRLQSKKHGKNETGIPHHKTRAEI